MELDLPASAAGWAAADDERDLVRRAQKDPTAFAAIYRLHCSAIAGYVHRRVGDVHTAEDLVADVFLIALRSIGDYRERGLPFRSWLYRIASNRVNRWARRERRRVSSIAAAAISRREGTYQAADPTAGAAEDRLAATAARRALLALAPRYQTVLALHYLEGLSVEEVARTIGSRVGTVKSRLSRGREKLRRQLEIRSAHRKPAE